MVLIMYQSTLGVARTVKTSVIGGDKMQREDLLAKGYTEEQVTDYLNMYHNMQKEIKQANEKANESKTIADGLQKQLDDINQANMSEQEKLVQKEKEIETNLANSRKIYNKAKAKELLAGYEIEDEIIDNLISEDENITISNANRFKSRLDTIIANTTKKVQDNIASRDVKPVASNIPQEDEGMTKEKFFKLPMSEQVIFKRENPEKAEEFFN